MKIGLKAVIWINAIVILGFHILSIIGLFMKYPFWDVVAVIQQTFSPFNISFYFYNFIALCPLFVSYYFLNKMNDAPTPK